MHHFLLLMVLSLVASSCTSIEATRNTAQKPAPIVISLHARDVEIHGTTVRYEPQTNKNTIGYWTKVEDWVSWKVQVPKAGSYHVDILQGCGKGQGGSEVEFSANDQVLKVIVEDTGHFQNFVWRPIGQFKFTRPGDYQLSVKPKTKARSAVMDLREVKLTEVR